VLAWSQAAASRYDTPSTAIACWRELRQADLLMPDALEGRLVLAWSQAAVSRYDAPSTAILYWRERKQADLGMPVPRPGGSATQQALAVDAATRPQDRGYFEIQIGLNCFPIYRCGATEARAVGPHTTQA
jgi:hypothetical protein